MDRRHASTSSTRTVFAVLGIVVFLLGLIGFAVLFAPDKPVAPPPSVISYEPRPQREFRLKDMSAPPPLRAQDVSHDEVIEPEPEVEPEPIVEADEPGLFVITGTVTDARTGEKLNRVWIKGRRVWSEAENAEWTLRDREAVESKDNAAWEANRERVIVFKGGDNARTNQAGRFSLTVTMPGDYMLSAHREGHLPQKDVPLLVVEGQKTARIDIVLSRGATISGRVTETGSTRGAVGVVVQLSDADDQDARPFFLEFENRNYRQGIETNADGYYELGGLLPQEYGVYVSVRGSPYRAGDVVPYQRVRIWSPEEQVTDVDFTVDAAGLVWGYVTDPEKEPVEADLVLVNSESMVSQALTAAMDAALRSIIPVTDQSEEDGYYELVGVPLNEEWRVYATANDHAPQLADPFMLTNAKRTARVDIFMFDGTTVYGAVLDSDGAPIPHAEVTCIPGYADMVMPMHSARAIRGTQSDSDGLFEIRQLPEGDYQVFAVKKEFKFAATGVPLYSDGYNDITGLRIILQAVNEGKYAIYGVVEDQSGAPVPDARIEVGGLGMESLNALERSTTTDANGEFRIEGMEAGMYMMMAGAEGYADELVSRVLLDEPTYVTLAASALVEGRVLVRETSRPPADYTVSAMPIRSSGSSTLGMLSMFDGRNSRHFNAEDGSFLLSLSAGRYQLEAKADSFTPARMEIELEAGDRLDGITFYLSRGGGSISGWVVTADGKSPQGAEVVLVEAGSAGQALVMFAAIREFGQRTTRLGADGNFSFEDLPAGSYNVVVQHPSYTRGDSGLLTLGENDEVGGIEIRLGSGGALEGYVYRSGRPVPEATIIVLAGGIPATTTTDQSGYYLVEDLAAGTLQVTLVPGTTPGALLESRGASVEITEGYTTRYDFGDGTGIRLEGRCEPPPQIAGLALLRPPGSPVPRPGEFVELTSLTGSPAIIGPTGTFVLEDVRQGEWQLDIYYSQFLEARHVHTEYVMVTGEEEVIILDLAVSLLQ